MAKHIPFFSSLLRQNPKPNFRHLSTSTTSHHQQQQHSKIALEVCEIIRTKPRWETTLLSHFPTFNFMDPTFFKEVLKLQDNAFLSLRFFNWLSSQSGFVPPDYNSCCKSLFAVLVQSNASVVAKSFLDTFPEVDYDPLVLQSLICCLCDDGFVDGVFDVFVKLKSLDVCPSVVVWNHALFGAVRARRTDVVWELYGEMMISRVVADVETVGYLIEACCFDGNVERGYELVREISDGGVVPGNVAMNRLIGELAKCGRYDRVSELLHLMIETNHLPDICTYQGVINGLCKNGRAAEGYRIFNDLKSRGYAPDRVMYTTMIHGLCGMKLVGKAKDLWFEMKKKCIVPDKYTYNVLINGCFRVCELEEALKLEKEMRDRGYKLDYVTYNTLIAGLCKSRRTKDACDLFEEMSRNGVAPNVITYNSLIRGFCGEGDMAKGQLLFEELLTHGLQPTGLSYTPFIEQYCRSGRTHQALELLTDMVNRGVEPSIYNRECIIDGLCREGSPIEGLTWLFEILDRKLIPRQEIFETLVRCLSEQDKLDAALVVLNSMLPIGYMLGKMYVVPLLGNFVVLIQSMSIYYSKISPPIAKFASYMCRYKAYVTLFCPPFSSQKAEIWHMVLCHDSVVVSMQVANG